MFAPTPAQVRQLLSGIRLKSTWGQRDYLLIMLLAHTGLRIGEMSRLLVDNVAHEGEPRPELFVPSAITKGKNGVRRSRVVPLNPTAQTVVAKLLDFNKKRGFSVGPKAPLFPWKRHQPVPPARDHSDVQPPAPIRWPAGSYDASYPPAPFRDRIARLWSRSLHRERALRAPLHHQHRGLSAHNTPAKTRKREQAESEKL